MKSAPEDRDPHPLLKYCQAAAPITEVICPICWELLAGNICITCCGHLFHADCLLQWFDCSKTCPQCRVACATFHRIAPFGVPVESIKDLSSEKIPSNASENALSDTFWLLVAFFVLVLCCRVTKRIVHR
uniref:RING-type domain-containing protein n=1 Tax=Anopheles stephensi TaxID=30069 RepID=A0A182Y308_ANOST